MGYSEEAISDILDYVKESLSEIDSLCCYLSSGEALVQYVSIFSNDYIESSDMESIFQGIAHLLAYLSSI